MTQWKHLWKDVGIVYKYFMGQPGDVIPAHEYMNISSFYFIFILFYSIKDLMAAWKKSVESLKEDMLFLPYSQLFILQQHCVPSWVLYQEQLFLYWN